MARNHDPARIDDEDNPELADADFACAKPFIEVLPEQYEAWKVHIGFRLAADVVAGDRQGLQCPCREGPARGPGREEALTDRGCGATSRRHAR